MSLRKKLLLIEAGVFLLSGLIALSGNPVAMAVAAVIWLCGSTVVGIVCLFAVPIGIRHNLQRDRDLVEEVAALQRSGAMGTQHPFSAREAELLRGCERRLLQIQHVERRPGQYVVGMAVGVAGGIYDVVKVADQGRRALRKLP